MSLLEVIEKTSESVRRGPKELRRAVEVEASYEPLNILREARALIEDKEHWTMGAFARTIYGREIVNPEHPMAHKFCLLGAALRATADRSSNIDDKGVAFRYLREATLGGQGSGSRFNDESTHAEVLALYDRAIQQAKEAA